MKKKKQVTTYVDDISINMPIALIPCTDDCASVPIAF